MDTTGREYRYQADYTVGGQMFHIRCDSFEDFKEACENLGIPHKPGDRATTVPATPSESSGPTACKTCGADTYPEQKIVGRDGRSWWVRNCVTGDKSHKGPIRQAV